jgi:Na+/alanine symporter
MNAQPSFAPVLLIVLLLAVFGGIVCTNAWLIAKRCRSFIGISLHCIVLLLAILGVVAIYSGQFIANDFEVVVPLLIIGQLVALLCQRKQGHR